MEPCALAPSAAFSLAEREAVYRAIFTRRDVRSQFLPDPVPDDVLARLLNAAHHAPSVGFMQPWSFIVLRSLTVRKRLHGHFLKANEEAAALFSGERAEKCLSISSVLCNLLRCGSGSRDRTAPRSRCRR